MSTTPTPPTELADQLRMAMKPAGATARSAFVACHYLLAAGSTLVLFYFIVSHGAVQGWNPWFATPLAYAAGWGWYTAIENPLRRFVLLAMAFRLLSKAERAGLSIRMRKAGTQSYWITGALALATVSLSLLINFDLSEVVTTEQDSSAETQVANRAVDSYDADVARLEAAVKRGRRRDAELIAEAEARGHEGMNRAINSKGAEMARLYKQGNGWAAGELRGRISQAARNADEHLAVARAEATHEARAEAALAAYTARSSRARDSVLVSYQGVVVGRRMDYLGTLGRRTWMLGIAVGFIFVVYLLSARLLVLACLENKETIDPHDEGETMGQMVRRRWSTLNRWLAARIDNKLPVMAAPTSAAALSTIPPPASTTPPTKPVIAPAPAPTKTLPAPTGWPTKPAVPTIPPAPTKPKMSARPSAPLSAKPSAGLSAKVSVGISVGTRGLVVEIDDKSYTARQAADKVAKWYQRWKAAKTEKTADKNRQRYEQARRQMEDHFVFTERERSVSIRQK